MEIKIGDIIHYLRRSSYSAAWDNRPTYELEIYEVLDIDENQCHWLFEKSEKKIRFTELNSVMYKDIIDNYVNYNGRIIQKSIYRNERINEIIED